jgi:hypothetical protein
MHNPKRCYTAGKWRDSINHSNSIAPRIGAVAGCIVDGPGDGRNLGFLVANTEEEGRHIVDTLKETGADFIKVYSLLTPKVYAAIADEAKKQNIPFAGHIPIMMDAVDCAAAGQKSFEHLDNFLQYCSTDKKQFLQFYRDSVFTAKTEAFERMARLKINSFDSVTTNAFFKRLAVLGTFVDPTYVVMMPDRWRKRLMDEKLLSTKDIPAELTVWMSKRTDNPYDDDLEFELFRYKLKLIRYFEHAHVKLMTGTDVSTVQRLAAGYSLHDELEIFVAYGLTPLEALQTATLNPAIFLNRQDELGSVEKGKLADLVLLDANPMTDIKNANKIFAVINNGRFLNRAALDNLKKQAVQAVLKTSD